MDECQESEYKSHPYSWGSLNRPDGEQFDLLIYYTHYFGKKWKKKMPHFHKTHMHNNYH